MTEDRRILELPPVDIQECLKLNDEVSRLTALLTAQEEASATPLLMATRETASGVCLECCRPRDPEKIWDGISRMMKLGAPGSSEVRGAALQRSTASGTRGGSTFEVPILPHLTHDEFVKIPIHLRNTVDLPKFNQGIDELNLFLEKKYTSKNASALKALRNEPAALKQLFWFSAKDLVNLPGIRNRHSVFKLGKTTFGILAILRHLHLLQSLQDGTEKRYAIADGSII